MKKTALFYFIANLPFSSMGHISHDSNQKQYLLELGLHHELWDYILDLTLFDAAILNKAKNIFEGIILIQKHITFCLHILPSVCKTFRTLISNKNQKIMLQEKLKDFYLNLLKKNFLETRNSKQNLYPIQNNWYPDNQINKTIAHFIATGQLLDYALLVNLILDYSTHTKHAKRRTYKLIHTLLFYGLDPDICLGPSQTSPLCLAIHTHSEDNNLMNIINLLLNYGANPNIHKILGIAPLDYVIQTKKKPHREKLVKLLLAQGANPNLQNRNGKSALHWAINAYTSQDKITKKIITLLLDHNANPNLKDRYGTTPLHQAINKHHINRNMLDIILLLLKNGANPNIKNSEGKTTLQMAREFNISL